STRGQEGKKATRRYQCTFSSETQQAFWICLESVPGSSISRPLRKTHTRTLRSLNIMHFSTFQNADRIRQHSREPLRTPHSILRPTMYFWLWELLAQTFDAKMHGFGQRSVDGRSVGLSVDGRPA
ncbi:Protein CBG14813, partial [Caenorhabditis briggsae]